MVGRLQVAAPGAQLSEPAQPIEVAALLKGDNSEAAFAALVRQHATSGVSGVVPKFLDAQAETGAAPADAMVPWLSTKKPASLPAATSSKAPAPSCPLWP